MGIRGTRSTRRGRPSSCASPASPAAAERGSGPAPDRILPMKDRLRRLLSELMLIPGLSGYEGRVRRHLAKTLDELGVGSRSDRLGNLIATLDGDADAPSVMLFAHMDQLGLIVRKVEA